MKKFLSRKFIITISVFVILIALLCAGILPPEEFRTIFLANLGLYFTGNVVGKFTDQPTQ